MTKKISFFLQKNFLRLSEHSKLDRITPDQFYFNSLASKEAA